MRVSRRARLSLRAIALLYLLLLLLLPVAVVFGKTFEHGFGVAWSWMTTPAAISAFWLSVTLAAIAVPLNTVFGIVCALVLVRRRGRAAARARLADRPAVPGLAGDRRPGADARLRDPRLVRDLVRRPRDPDHLRAQQGWRSRPCSSHCRSSCARWRRCWSRSATSRSRRRRRSARRRGRRSGGSRCRRSAGASPTASCSRPRGRWGRSAPCWSSRRWSPDRR